MVLVAVPVRVAVVAAAIRRLRQPAFQECGHQLLHPGPGRTRPHGDPVLSEQVQRPSANARHNDHVHPMTVQPLGKGSRTMFGPREHFGAKDSLLFRIHFDQGKLAAAAEVVVQAAVFMRDGDFHK